MLCKEPIKGFGFVRIACVNAMEMLALGEAFGEGQRWQQGIAR